MKELMVLSIPIIILIIILYPWIEYVINLIICNHKINVEKNHIINDSMNKYRRIKTYKEGGLVESYEHPLTKTMKPKEEIEIEHKPMIDFKDIPFWEVGKSSVVKEVEKIPIISSKPTPGLFITDKYRNIPELNRMKECVKNGNII